MLAGMGGVSYHRLAAAVSEAGGFGCLGASTMCHEQMLDEMDRVVRALTDKPFGVDLLTAAPQDMVAKVSDIIDHGASVFVAGLGVPRDVIDLCHERNILVVNMCGKVRHAVAAVEAGCDIVVAQGTEAGGHTGQVGDHGPRAPDRRCGGRPRARGRRRRALRRPRARRGAHPRRRRHLGGHPLHRHARGTGGAGLQGTLLDVPRGRHARHPRLHGQDLPSAPHRLRDRLRAVGRHSAAVPGPGVEVDGGRRQPPRRRRDVRRVDPDREFMPAGQGVGAIDELVPAGELVARFVAEAEAALDRATGARS